MRFLVATARRLGCAHHTYVAGGAVRDFWLGQPIKDLDLVVDPKALPHGRNASWFARHLARAITADTNLTTNQYGVAILTIKGAWSIGPHGLAGEVLEIANARVESYGGAAGKHYKPTRVRAATIMQDMRRRDFTYNCLLWRLDDLHDGPDREHILDLTRQGLRDLRDGVIRTAAKPDRTFADDPTRMLRAIKFAVRYGHDLEHETERSIVRNAALLRAVPHNAVSVLLCELWGHRYRDALAWMRRLGLLGVVVTMLRETTPFRCTVERWLDHQAVDVMIEVMRALTLRRLGFLTDQQLDRLLQIAGTLSGDAALSFLAALRQPGRVLDSEELRRRFDLKGAEFGFAERRWRTRRQLARPSRYTRGRLGERRLSGRFQSLHKKISRLIRLSGVASCSSLLSAAPPSHVTETPTTP
jgi:tRNA nucleotidyltransferase/poly(A) polymerase